MLKTYPETVFKVDENGESFKYHKLTNQFLQENGVSIKTALDNFYNSLQDVDIIIGQNIMTADIHMIRKEAIGEGMWFGKIRESLKGKSIYDTMLSFRDKNPEEKSSLDSIYKFLFDKEMKNHHDATHDCKNTFAPRRQQIATNSEEEVQYMPVALPIADLHLLRDLCRGTMK